MYGARYDDKDGLMYCVGVDTDFGYEYATDFEYVSCALIVMENL